MNKPLTPEERAEDEAKFARDLAQQPPPSDPRWNNSTETFAITLNLTQDQINDLGELFFDDNLDCAEGHILYNMLVNAASEAGADLP